MREQDSHASGLHVLVAGGDLLARSRITDAADRAGSSCSFVSLAELPESLEAGKCKILILDLDEGREAALARLVEARTAGNAPQRALGYFSHIDVELGKAARSAGLEVYPRGRFWRTLPELLGGG